MYPRNQLKLKIIKDIAIIFYTACIQPLFLAPILSFGANRVKTLI